MVKNYGLALFEESESLVLCYLYLNSCNINGNVGLIGDSKLGS